MRDGLTLTMQGQWGLPSGRGPAHREAKVHGFKPHVGLLLEELWIALDSLSLSLSLPLPHSHRLCASQNKEINLKKEEEEEERKSPTESRRHSYGMGPVLSVVEGRGEQAGQDWRCFWMFQPPGGHKRKAKNIPSCLQA